MKSLALTDKNKQPDDRLLEQVLQQMFTLYQQLRQQLRESEIEIMWNYYNDGKAWLGKLMWRKKNLGWVHVYDQAFRIVVFFTENTGKEYWNWIYRRISRNVFIRLLHLENLSRCQSV